MSVTSIRLKMAARNVTIDKARQNMGVVDIAIAITQIIIRDLVAPIATLAAITTMDIAVAPIAVAVTITTVGIARPAVTITITTTEATAPTSLVTAIKEVVAARITIATTMLARITIAKDILAALITVIRDTRIAVIIQGATLEVSRRIQDGLLALGPILAIKNRALYKAPSKERSLFFISTPPLYCPI